MKLCLYNGSKKKKSSPKKAKKNNSTVSNGRKNVNKNGSRSKKTDRKKKTPVLVELSLDPPSLCSKFSIPQDETGSNGTVQEALDFWNYVDSYTNYITKEDINYLNQLTDEYSKENCPLINILPSNQGSSPDFPDNWVERIVGALVDPDLFPGEEENLDHHPKMHEDPEPKRMKLCDGSDTVSGGGGVFSERSNLLNLGSLYVDEEEDDVMPNCDTKSDQDDSDEISLEILKCQEELKLLCRENEKTLTRLSARAQRDFENQHLSQNLRLCESELVKLTQQKHSSAHRLKKETVTSSSRKSKDEEKLLLQRRDFLLASLRDQED